MTLKPVTILELARLHQLTKLLVQGFTLAVSVAFKMVELLSLVAYGVQLNSWTSQICLI